METKQTSENNIDGLKEVINKTNQEVFSYSYIDKLAALNGYHQMNFYFMVYAGCFTKLKRGLYKKNPLLNQLTSKEILKRATAMLKERKQYRKLIAPANPIKVDANIEKQTSLTEDACIKHLKKLGYKIMKPIQQYKEV